MKFPSKEICEKIDEASKLFACACVEYREMLLIYHVTIEYQKQEQRIASLEEQLCKVKSQLQETPFLQELAATLRTTIDDLRDQVEDKRQLVGLYREKLNVAEAEVKRLAKDKKRFKRTNQEVAKIISDSTIRHVHCVHLNWSESKISRLNNGKSIKESERGYPGNDASLEKIRTWAIEIGMRRKKVKDQQNRNKQFRTPRFEGNIISVDPDKLEYYANKHGYSAEQNFHERLDDE